MVYEYPLEYPLSKTIEADYTRTPFAMTRSDIDFFNFGDEQLDKLMLLDGISCHEKVKRKLAMYAANHSTSEKPVRTVKPFILVVCKDTDHTAWVESFIKSDEFRNSAYRNKAITVHSKQRDVATEFNTRLLLGVEKPDNPVEIVIHVNMLKVGRDVNNSCPSFVVSATTLRFCSLPDRKFILRQKEFFFLHYRQKASF